MPTNHHLSTRPRTKTPAHANNDMPARAIRMAKMRLIGLDACMVSRRLTNKAKLQATGGRTSYPLIILRACQLQRIVEPSRFAAGLTEVQRAFGRSSLLVVVDF